MLSKEYRNRHISFRYLPRDHQSIAEEIRCDMLRRMRKLNCSNDVENKVKNVAQQFGELAIEEMSSMDIYKDRRADFRTHARRVRDVLHTNKCWQAICCNAHLFKDKIVLDVSCDLGQLSLFSALAGAKHVYAIDSSSIVQCTDLIIADNNLTSKITVFKGKVADISLPVEKVDVIVSNFFGQSLFCDNRLDELIDARDKWLKPDGLMFPDKAVCYIGGLNNHLSLDRSNFWQHVYKFDMRPMIDAVNLEPYLQFLTMPQVVTGACPIKKLSMYTVQKDDYKRFDAPFRLEVGSNTLIGALFTYFEIEFNEGVVPIKFTIQPGWPQTAWVHLVFFLSMNNFQLDRGEVFYGVFRMNAISEDYRQIDWNIEISHRNNHCGFRKNWDFQTR